MKLPSMFSLFYHFVRSAAALAVFTSLSGCMSGISATKVTCGKNPKGQRVYLPAPFLVGRPNPAGTIDWKIECLPDPDEEYAVHAWAFLAKNNVKIARTKSGMLTKVETDMDTTAVASQLAKTGGAIGNEALGTAIKQKTEAATAETTRQGQLMAGRTSLVQKKRALEVAREDYQRALTKTSLAKQALEAARAGTDAAAISTAKKDLQSAEDAEYTTKKAMTAAEQAVEDAQMNITALGGTYDDIKSNLDAPAAPPPPARVKVPGPVIYRIVENNQTGIELKKVDFTVFNFTPAEEPAQLSVSTWGKKEEKKKEAK